MRHIQLFALRSYSLATRLLSQRRIPSEPLKTVPPGSPAVPHPSNSSQAAIRATSPHWPCPTVCLAQMSGTQSTCRISSTLRRKSERSAHSLAWVAVLQHTTASTVKLGSGGRLYGVGERSRCVVVQYLSDGARLWPGRV